MLDGVKDGLLENPTRCTFDPKEIECRSGDAANCLTTTQVEAARKIYAGPTNPRTNERIWSPLYRGSELDWSFFTEAAGPIGIATSALRMILGDPAWDYRKSPVDFDRHVALADKSDIARVNASNPDISAYVRARRQADSLGRLEQRARAGGRRPGLLQQRSSTIGVEETQRGGSPLHGPRHDRMQWRTWHRHLRHAQCHAALGRARPGAERGARVARRARESGAHAAAVSVPAGGDIPGQREHGRCGNFVCR